MAEVEAAFEVKDNVGRSESFSGTATTVVQNIPSVSGEIISGVIFVAEENNIEVSFDSGTSFFQLDRNDVLNLDVKGEIRQFQVRAISGNRDFKCIVNFEDY